MFQMGGKFGAVSFLQIVAPELSDRMLADFMDAENGIIVNLHIQSIDHNEAIKTIKRKITDLDRMKIEEQKKAIRSGYDMDIIPSDLATYGGEAKNLLRDLQSRNERMFLLTLLVLNLADTKQKLDNEVFGAARALKEMQIKKLPDLAALRKEYSSLNDRKSKLYEDYRQAKKQMQERKRRCCWSSSRAGYG